MVEELLTVGLSPGRVKDSRIHSPEDLLLQEAHDQLPDSTEHPAEIQVSHLYRGLRPVQNWSDQRPHFGEPDGPEEPFLPSPRFFYQFLLANERTVAKEIRDEYVDTMSKIYCSYFKSYSSRLLKVQVSGHHSTRSPEVQAELLTAGGFRKRRFLLGRSLAW